MKLEITQDEYDFLIKIMLQQIEAVTMMKSKLPDESVLDKAGEFIYNLFKKINEAK